MNLITANWTPIDHKFKLKQNQLAVFKFDIDEFFFKIEFSYHSILSTQELAKIEKFRRIQDRKRYIVARYYLRHLIAYFLDLDPAEVRFQEQVNKKPSVIGIEFNSSYSNNQLILAFAEKPIGIDFEFVNPSFDYKEIITECFDLNEQIFLKSPDTDQALRFFHLWTRKEAILKATGEGLIDDLASLNCLADRVERSNFSLQLESFISDNAYVLSIASTYPATPPSFYILKND